MALIAPARPGPDQSQQLPPARSPSPGFDPVDWAASAGFTALAFLVRAVFALRSGLTFYDPWRHLLLHENVRSGRGFVLYGGEPYAYYNPAWYYFAALFPDRVSPEWIAAALSSIAAGALFLVLRAGWPRAGRTGAAVAAGLMACAGPVVNATVHLGPEAFALALVIAALLLVTLDAHVFAAAASGAALGLAVAARTHFALDAFVLLPFLRSWRSRGSAAAGLVAPLAWSWWRNHAILTQHAFIFTWDGLAVRSSTFSPLSTLVMQLNPDIRAALRLLHDTILEAPEWILTMDGEVAWGGIAFMTIGTLAVILTRNRALGAATLAGYLGLYVFDGSGTGRFFRMDLPLFVPMFIALGLLAGRLARGTDPLTGRSTRARQLAPVGLAALMLAAGAPSFHARTVSPLESFTPSADFLPEARYMVNSGNFLPDALMYRYPNKTFIGLPMHPEDFGDFRAAYPRFDAALLHRWSVQDEIMDYLEEEAGYRPVALTKARSGDAYMILRRR